MGRGNRFFSLKILRNLSRRQEIRERKSSWSTDLRVRLWQAALTEHLLWSFLYVFQFTSAEQFQLHADLLLNFFISPRLFWFCCGSRNNRYRELRGNVTVEILKRTHGLFLVDMIFVTKNETPEPTKIYSWIVTSQTGWKNRRSQRLENQDKLNLD